MQIKGAVLCLLLLPGLCAVAHGGEATRDRRWSRALKKMAKWFSTLR